METVRGMTRFRKKPVVVEAVRFADTQDPRFVAFVVAKIVRAGDAE